MEVLNLRAALLSNYEVLEVIREIPKSKKRSKVPQNLATVSFEVKEYLESSPCATQKPEMISNLMMALREFAITKAEKLQILNLKPKSIVELHLLLEECEERFEEEELEALVVLISKSLSTGSTPPPEEDGMEPGNDDEVDPDKLNMSRLTFEGNSVEIQHSIMSDF